MNNVTMEYSESRGTWNVFCGAEWYFEGTLEQAEQIFNSFFWNDDEVTSDYEADEWGW